MMQLYRYLLIINCLILCMSSSLWGASAPQITSVNISYMNSGVNAQVQWHSEEPVIQVFILTGSQQNAVPVDPRDNSRIPSGFVGETNSVLPITQGGMVTVYVVDEYRRKSETVSVPVVAAQRQSVQHGTVGSDDGWGKEHLPRSRSEQPQHGFGMNQPVNSMQGSPGSYQPPQPAMQQPVAAPVPPLVIQQPIPPNDPGIAPPPPPPPPVDVNTPPPPPPVQ